MNIAYLCTSKSLGGLELNHLRNASWMQARSHNVLCLFTEGSSLALEAKKMNLPTVCIPYTRRYYPLFKAFQVAKLLKENRITHVFIRDNRDMSMLATLKCILGKKVITAYFMEMQLGLTKKGILHSVRFSFLDYWFCPLPFLQKQTKEWTHIAHRKVYLLPSGLDFSLVKNMPRLDAREQLNVPQEAFIFGLIGRFDRLKGQLLVLEAMQTMKQLNFVLVFLGEETKNESNGVLSEIHSTIEKNGWSEKVLIRPFMSSVGIFYSAIDALIMATKAETFGMVTLEALAHGLPVIGSNQGGTPDLLDSGRYGLLFESENPHSLAQAMDQLLDNPLAIEANERQKHLAQFDHQKVCQRIEEMLT
jgi:glycosyltransferase involved in cell wall biosynthesis